MIRVRHLTLPAGLIAVVRKDSDGELQVFVSDALAAGRQRAAVRLALRSIRPPGWRTGLLPLPIGLPLSAVWRSITRTVRAHGIASSTVGFLAVAGTAALIVGLPQHHGPALAGQGPGRSQVRAPAPARRHIAARPGPSGNLRPTPGSARGSTGTRPGPITATPAPQSAAPPASQPALPEPSKSAAAPPAGAPSATPTAASSPSPSPPSTGVTCVVILGVWVCL